jgi:hypothetical protein
MVDIDKLEITTPTKANAKKPLEIPTYDGSGQTTHPKVLYFEEGWNGYRYWMVHTPYPNSMERYENPCIVVSNDGINWKEPAGLTNPIDSVNSGGGWYRHYSDGHLLMKNGTMELWYRLNESSNALAANNANASLLRTSSTDGVHWSKPEKMLTASNSALSPVVMWEDGKYRMWYASNTAKLYYTESATGYEWEELQQCSIPAENGVKLWHQDIIKTDIGYEMLFCGKSLFEKSPQTHEELYYTASKDGLSFISPTLIISYKNSIGGFDNNSIYRASLLKFANGSYSVYYSAMSNSGEWRIALTQGKSISELGQDI